MILKIFLGDMHTALRDTCIAIRDTCIAIRDTHTALRDTCVALRVSLLSLIGLSTNAQNWCTATIDSIPKTAYYNIQLDKRIVAVSDMNLTTIRINDKSGAEVPYFVRPSNPSQSINEFVAYPLISNTEKDSINTLIIKNERGESISRLSIMLEGADVDKYVRVRGSNNQQQWYIVKQRENITYSGFKDGNNEVLIVDFPQGNYLYYEITLTNNQNSPLKVLNVGRFKNSNIYVQQTAIDLGRFVKTDSVDKKTYIYFPDLVHRYRIDKLTFYIHNKAEYYRTATISGDISFSLSSKTENTIVLNSLAISADTKIVIDNKGNPPLVIDSIRVTALNRYLCAYLEQGQHYTLAIGNPAMVPSAEYDIKLFQKEIPEDLQIVPTANFQLYELPKPLPDKERERIWIEKPLFLWSIIILVGVFLSAICYKMVLEMKRRG